MSLQNVIWIFSSGALLTWLLLVAIMPFLNRNLLDTPNHRSSHILPIPRGGGIAFVIIGSILNLATSTGASRWVPIICIPLAIVGIVDDYKDLPASWRYIIQVLTAIALLLVGRIHLPILTFVTLVILLTAIINFTNFMDGLDGLVAGCGILLMAATSSWAISGAIFGFLVLNWSPARVFMGDVGSTYIGAVFSGLILQDNSYPNMVGTLLVGFPIFGDAFVCVLRRFICGEAIFKAHRKHLFQRLNQAGWNHRKVASLYITATLLLLVARNMGGVTLLILTIGVEACIAVYLDTKVAAKFLKGN